MPSVAERQRRRCGGLLARALSGEQCISFFPWMFSGLDAAHAARPAIWGRCGRGTGRHTPRVADDDDAAGRPRAHCCYWTGARGSAVLGQASWSPSHRSSSSKWVPRGSRDRLTRHPKNAGPTPFRIHPTRQSRRLSSPILLGSPFEAEARNQEDAESATGQGESRDGLLPSQQ